MYEIRRFYRADRPYDVVKTVETLEEAQEHCNDPVTSNLEDGWFDGYEEIEGEPFEHGYWGKGDL